VHNAGSSQLEVRDEIRSRIDNLFRELRGPRDGCSVSG
jgi:hypothetical protein